MGFMHAAHVISMGTWNAPAFVDPSPRVIDQAGE
jgi:hypothetical protein